MKIAFCIELAVCLLALVHGASAQSQGLPNVPAAPATEPIVRERSADPYRLAKAVEVVPAGQRQSDTSPKNISLKWEVFSLPMTEAHKFLNAFKTDPERYAEIVRWAESGRAKLEELQMLRTRSGQRAKVEAIDEKIYPTKFVPPHQPAEPPRLMVPNPAYKPAEQNPNAAAPPPFVAQPTTAGSPGNPLPYASPTAFETRNVGTTLEIEPTLSPDGQIIDVTVAPEFVRFMGHETHTLDRSVMQPQFQTQRLATACSLKSGSPFLLGTQSPPQLERAEGAEKTKVVWLSFMTAEAVGVQ